LKTLKLKAWCEKKYGRQSEVAKILGVRPWLLEEAARVDGAAVRKALKEGVSLMEEAIAVSRRIAWLSLAAAIVALLAAVCASLRT
jgi:hypothetical protein